MEHFTHAPVPHHTHTYPKHTHAHARKHTQVTPTPSKTSSNTEKHLETPANTAKHTNTEYKQRERRHHCIGPSTTASFSSCSSYSSSWSPSLALPPPESSYSSSPCQEEPQEASGGGLGGIRVKELNYAGNTYWGEGGRGALWERVGGGREGPARLFYGVAKFVFTLFPSLLPFSLIRVFFPP